MFSKTVHFGYYFAFTLWQSICSFGSVFAQGMRIYRASFIEDEQEPAWVLDPDEVISQMDAKELCSALNNAMYLHPDDPETLYPDWFVELAREGIFLAGVMALNDHVHGECVVKFNGKVIAFEQDSGGWVPVQMAH